MYTHKVQNKLKIPNGKYQLCIKSRDTNTTEMILYLPNTIYCM